MLFCHISGEFWLHFNSKKNEWIFFVYNCMLCYGAIEFSHWNKILNNFPNSFIISELGANDRLRNWWHLLEERVSLPISNCVSSSLIVYTMFDWHWPSNQFLFLFVMDLKVGQIASILIVNIYTLNSIFALTMIEWRRSLFLFFLSILSLKLFRKQWLMNLVCFFVP